MWTFHDRAGHGHLTSTEARAVSMWLYSRIPVLFRSMIASSAAAAAAAANPRGGSLMSREQQSALVLEHLAHLLPGTSEEIADYFVSTLKLNEQNRVSKEEFVRCWNRHARVICPTAQQKNLPKGAAYCTIL